MDSNESITELEVKDYLSTVSMLFANSKRGPLEKYLTVPTYRSKSVDDNGRITRTHVAYQWSENARKSFNCFAEYLAKSPVELGGILYTARYIENRPTDFVMFAIPAKLARFSGL